MTKQEAYTKKVEAQLEEWSAEIDKLKARGKKSGADAELAYQRRVEDLERKRDEAQDQLEELRDASGDAWEDIKAGVESARESLAEALQSARERFK